MTWKGYKQAYRDQVEAILVEHQGGPPDGKLVNALVDALNDARRDGETYGWNSALDDH